MPPLVARGPHPLLLRTCEHEYSYPICANFVVTTIGKQGRKTFWDGCGGRSYVPLLFMLTRRVLLEGGYKWGVGREMEQGGGGGLFWATRR